MRRFVEELTDRRIAAYQAAVDLVIRTSDEHAVELITASARSLYNECVDAVSIINAVKNMLEGLFWDRIQEETARTHFETIVDGVLTQISESRLHDHVDGENAFTDSVDWNFWLTILRGFLDALKPEFGLPGVQTISRLHLDVTRFRVQQ